MASNQDRKKKQRQMEFVSAKGWVDSHQGGSGFSTLNLPDGCNLWGVKEEGVKRFDVIPYCVGKGNPRAQEGKYYYERTYYTHRNVGPSNDSYVCPAKTFNKKCPICEFRYALDKKTPKSQDEADSLRKQVKDMEPKERQLWNIYDHKQPDKGVQVWEVSYHLFGKQLRDKIHLSEQDGEDEDYGFFAHPDSGYTLKVGFKKETAGSYGFIKASDIEFKPRKDSLGEELLDRFRDTSVTNL